MRRAVLQFASAMLFALMLTSLGAAACDTRDAKSKEGLIAVENRWVAALDKMDQQALACILAPEFKDSGVYGELRERQKVLDDLPHRKPASQQLQNLEAILLGDSGVVRGVNHLTTSNGKPLADVRFTDVFVYRENRWQAVSAQETLIEKNKKH